jgi:hypothetical protein
MKRACAPGVNFCRWGSLGGPAAGQMRALDQAVNKIGI